jgi:NAD-dependent SIR2 family protein deacetylase
VIDVRSTIGAMLPSARWRSTHESKVGPICPKCGEPLETHFVWHNAADAMRGRTAVRSGQSTRQCFTVGVR